MIERIDSLLQEALAAFSEAATSETLYGAKVKYLGKQGGLSFILKEIGKLTPEEKKSIGARANAVRDELEQKYSARLSALEQTEMAAKLSQDSVDVTLPGAGIRTGGRHPIWKVTQEICAIFAKLGFSVRTGPHIEKDFYNFDALNMPADHAARDMQDTFYVEDGGKRLPGELSPWVLRTHTSPVQIRTMLTEKPPIRIVIPGGVYRSDSDVSHSPNFHQIEGLLVDTDVSMSDLKGTLGYFAREYFGSEVQVRLRPSYFPFVEPGAELDASCPLCKAKGCSMCKGSGWIELAGCGMVHPSVFKQAGLEYPKWNGFAFGMGVERIAVVKYGVSHIGLFTENDTRFLEQFRP